MTLAIIGVNYKTAPIALRERIAISREDLPETTRALAAVEGVTECMIVSTCNRVELLAAVESPETDLTGFLHQHFGLDRGVESRGRLVEDEEPGAHRQRHGDDHALLHAARELVREVPQHPPGTCDLHARQHLRRALERRAAASVLIIPEGPEVAEVHFPIMAPSRLHFQ